MCCEDLRRSKRSLNCWNATFSGFWKPPRPVTMALLVGFRVRVGWSGTPLVAIVRFRSGPVVERGDGTSIMVRASPRKICVAPVLNVSLEPSIGVGEAVLGEAVLDIFASSRTASGLPELSTLTASPNLRIENRLLLLSPYRRSMRAALSASIRLRNERRKNDFLMVIAMRETPDCGWLSVSAEMNGSHAQCCRS